MQAYLSSTFADLIVHRERAYRALRSLRFDVIAMEDYVAADERPVDRCLADVANVDLYVGLFAFRYGHVPDVHNAQSRSITELEYRRAVECGIPRLIFMVPENAQWEVPFLDAVTGASERGERISNLRATLARDQLVSTFTTPDQLGAAVASSASNWLLSQPGSVPTGGTALVSQPPHPRQLGSDLLVLHVPADTDRATALGDALSSVWRVTTSMVGMRASSAAELRDLDRLVTSARTTAILLSPSSATVLAENRGRSRRVLGLVRDRTGGLLGISVGGTTPADEQAWGLTEVVRDRSPDGDSASDLAGRLHRTLVEGLGHTKSPEVGVPVVVVAMTAPEAVELLERPPAAVAALLDSVKSAERSWVGRYGPTREQWRPFAETDDTIADVLASGIAAVTRGADRLRGRSVRAQPYPLDALLHDNLDMWPIYQDIARTGCLVIVDELSLFNERIREVFATSPLPTGEQVAFVTVSPLDPFAGPPHVLVRQQLDAYLAQPARRFSEVLDPLCEMGIAERRRLNRWLHSNLPQAVANFRTAHRDPARIRDLEAELGLRANPALGRLIAGESGPE